MRIASRSILSFLRVIDRLRSLPLTSPPIGETLALDASERALGSSRVRDAAGVVAEIEFADVALEVLGADVVIHAENAALQDGEVALDGVGVRRSRRERTPRSSDSRCRVRRTRGRCWCSRVLRRS